MVQHDLLFQAKPLVANIIMEHKNAAPANIAVEENAATANIVLAETGLHH